MIRLTDSSILLVSLALLGLLAAPSFAQDRPAIQGSLTLDEAYRQALESNDRLQISRKQLRIAHQDVREAFSQLLPQLSISGESYRQKEVRQFGTFAAPTEETNFTGQLLQPLYQGGKNIAGLNVRQFQQKVAYLRLFRNKQEVLFEVARIYFDILLAQKNVKIQQNALRRARTQLERARARAEVGKTTKSAVLRAQVEVSDAREQLERASNAVSLAQEDLAVVLGVSTIPDTFQPVQFERMSDTPIRAFKKLAYENRRDLKRQAYEIDAAKARVNFELGDYYPSLNFVGNYYRYENESFHGSETDWRVAIQGSYPLFSGFQEDAQVKQARLRFKTARQEYRRLKREIRRNVRRVHLELQSQRTVIDTLRDRVESARENYKQIAAQFEEGLVDSVDVSDALTILNEAELRLASARNTLMLDRLRLKLATGTFLESLIKRKAVNYEFINQ